MHSRAAVLGLGPCPWAPSTFPVARDQDSAGTLALGPLPKGRGMGVGPSLASSSASAPQTLPSTPTGPQAPQGQALALARRGPSLKNTSEDRASSQVQPPDVCLPSFRGLAGCREGPGPGWQPARLHFLRKKSFSVPGVTPGPHHAVSQHRAVSDLCASVEPSGALGITPGAGSGFCGW